MWRNGLVALFVVGILVVGLLLLSVVRMPAQSPPPWALVFVDQTANVMYPPDPNLVTTEMQGASYRSVVAAGYRPANNANFGVVGPPIGEWLLCKIVGSTPIYNWEEFGSVGRTEHRLSQSAPPR